MEAIAPKTKLRRILIFVGAFLVTVFAVIGLTKPSIFEHNKSPFGNLIRNRRATESECFRVLIAREEVSTLTSPGYPDNYPSNVECYWLLTTLDENATISILIDTLMIEPEKDCSLDYLQVYLGSDPSTSPSLGKFCGIVKDRVLETNSSKVLLVFHSDVAYEDKGFAVDYFTKSNGDCKKSLSADSGLLTSPGFPNNYQDETECSTLISVQPGRKILLQFDSLDLEPGDSCTFDHVRIFDGNSDNSTLLGQICQETDVRTFESSSSFMLLHFHSDDSVNRRGYRARYTSVDVRSTPIGNCPWVAGKKNGTLSSPNYPDNYPSFANCSIWILAPEGHKILFRFEALLLEMESDCSYDFLQISEGPISDSKVLGRFCGRASEPKYLVSNKHEVQVRFQSDDFVEFLGFKFRYEFFKEETEKTKGTVDGNDVSTEELLTFRVRPRNATLPIGSSHILPCSVEHPNAKIRWLKGDLFLAGESPLPGLKVLSNNTLWIKDMGHHLAGRYTCVAVSPEGVINATADVRIEGQQEGDCKLKFRKTPQDSEVEKGDFVLLECLAPDAQVSWEREGRPMRRRDHVTVLVNGYVFVDGAEMDDAGLYTCVARDPVTGCERRADARLTVHARPNVDEICGISHVEEQKKSQMDNSKIVKGHDAEKGAYPWQVMLWEPKQGSFCGATLLNERWILTAAHCLRTQEIPWYTIRIKLGKHDRVLEEKEELETSIAEESDIKYHPEFSRRTLDNDLALIRLRDYVPFTDHILPVCLGDRNLTESLLNRGYGKGTVLGWGKLNEYGGLPRFLQEIELPIVDPTLCKESTQKTVTRSMFCAGYAQEVIGDACKGDSGGPFLMKHQGRWYLVGIVSWGEGCGRGDKYGFYTRVANHLSWIKGYIKS